MTLAAVHVPHIDYKALSPLIAVSGGSMIVLMIGLIRGRLAQRVLVPLAAAAATSGTTKRCTMRPRMRPTISTIIEPPATAKSGDSAL